ncbi:MAG TPA: DUF6036 family nucleotidyltransferase [Thermoanaerobaculia bacterium]|nr:DUF6036 family nucleotidyltransferase [Thermoanaerobaculia bacterium]
MRERLNEPRLRDFMRALAREARDYGRVYIAGGASAVLLGWRETTLDVDLKIIPEDDRLLRAIAALKESLNVNIEQATPEDFIPALPGWQDRSPFIAMEGKLSFHHYDFYAQALAKIERDHMIDREDVQNMIDAGLVNRTRLLELFEAIEPQLHRFLAINPRQFAERVRKLQ